MESSESTTKKDKNGCFHLSCSGNNRHFALYVFKMVLILSPTPATRGDANLFLWFSTRFEGL